jgi:hypothetical protein
MNFDASDTACLTIKTPMAYDRLLAPGLFYFLSYYQPNIINLFKSTPYHVAVGRDGLEGSFAAFGLQYWLVWAANEPYSKVMGALACH